MHKGAMRVSLFVPCFVDTLAPEVGLCTARLLSRLGHEVLYEEEQTCCGQPALSSGHFLEALPLARRQLDVLARLRPGSPIPPSTGSSSSPSSWWTFSGSPKSAPSSRLG